MAKYRAMEKTRNCDERYLNHALDVLRMNALLLRADMLPLEALEEETTRLDAVREHIASRATAMRDCLERTRLQQNAESLIEVQEILARRQEDKIDPIMDDHDVEKYLEIQTTLWGIQTTSPRKLKPTPRQRLNNAYDFIVSPKYAASVREVVAYVSDEIGIEDALIPSVHTIRNDVLTRLQHYLSELRKGRS